MLITLEEINGQKYDYIVCGAGTAGLTLAARLTEDPKVSVLVLEAGEPNLNDPLLLRPASFGQHFADSNLSWTYRTAKQKHASDVEYTWFRGKGLGGSSAINFFAWSKPPAEDIDDFQRLGNPGWNWQTYQKYIARTEGFVLPDKKIEDVFKMKAEEWEIGKTGPLVVKHPHTIDAAELRMQKTFLNAGLPFARKPLSGDTFGVHFTPGTYDTVTHTRTYAVTAHYLPVENRPNYAVLTGAHATKVLLSGKEDGTLTATGVEFYHSGILRTVTAEKEVILAAGGLKSSQILELSGIGKPDVLERIQVPLSVSLPGVGENVQEHFFIGISWELRDDVPFDTLCLLRDPALAAEHVRQHALGSGLHTTGIVGVGYTHPAMVTPRFGSLLQAAKDNINQNAHTYPPGLSELYEIQLERLQHGVGVEFASIPGLMSLPNQPKPGKRYVTILVAMNHPFSRGSIHSVSNDPMTEPEIDPNYFDHDVDLQLFLDAVKFGRNMANISPLKDMIAEELNPGPDVRSDEELSNWIKLYLSTTYHTAGACSMLPREKNGVVDPQLKVYGTNNLRVVDLSIVPLHFAAHAQATVYAIAEQAADIILGRTAA